MYSRIASEKHIFSVRLYRLVIFGRLKVCKDAAVLILAILIRESDVILQALIKRAQEVIAPYREGSIGAPEPSFVLQLPDEVYTGSNLYAVQKSFEGEFQFDVFYESASSKQHLSCELTPALYRASS